MYASTNLSVKVGNFYTDTFSFSTGVRQADNLSPTYSMFLFMISPHFDASCDPVKLTERYINCLLYADDLILLSNSAEGLRNYMKKLSTFCEELGMTINLDKTKSLVLSPGTRKKKDVNITFHGNSIENVKSYTYLGIAFTHTGCFNEAKDNLYLKGLKAQFKLSRSFYPQPPKVKTSFHILDHTIHPILTYRYEIWALYHLKSFYLKKIVIF